MINLNDGSNAWLRLPVPPLFELRDGPVIELVFWAPLPQRWIHAVSMPFQRQLPAGHVSVSQGELKWVQDNMRSRGWRMIIECVRALENRDRVG